MTDQFVISEFESKDLDSVKEFLSSNTWQFHTNDVSQDYSIERFTKEAKTFLAKRDGAIVGYIQIMDFKDGDTPLFDVRTLESERGKGLGTSLVNTATEMVFSNLPNTHRFEATTREDNMPMIALLNKLGWTQEACYRKGWKVSDSEYLNALGYSILREEWDALIL